MLRRLGFTPEEVRLKPAGLRKPMQSTTRPRPENRANRVPRAIKRPWSSIDDRLTDARVRARSIVGVVKRNGTRYPGAQRRRKNNPALIGEPAL